MGCQRCLFLMISAGILTVIAVPSRLARECSHYCHVNREWRAREAAVGEHNWNWQPADVPAISVSSLEDRYTGKRCEKRIEK
jgi:hypothetical protein